MDAGRVYRVGRDPENDIVIEHGSVSREHCELRVLDDGALLLADLGSMNGTAVRQNGQWEQIEQATVERDERILLGEIVTTVAAILARAPKTADRKDPASRLQRPRKIPRPTAPAQPDASGLIGRLVNSDWARLNLRSERWGRRDEPSICLPAMVNAYAPDSEPPARLLRNPAPLQPRKAPTAPEIGREASQHPILLAPPPQPATACAQPIDFAALASTPILRPDARGDTPARREPSLVGNGSRPNADIGPPPKPRRAARGRDNGGPPRARWLHRLGSPTTLKRGAAALALLLTSGVAVAAYLRYGPDGAVDARVAAATPDPPSASSDPPEAPGAKPVGKPETPKPASKATAKPGASPAHARPWQHSIEATPDSALHAAAAARDGMCLAGVTTLGGGQEAWVIRLETNGAVRWQRRPGGPKRDAALAVAAASDGGCVAAGYDSAETRLWVFKIDAKGVLAWSRTVPAGHAGRAVAIVRTRDNGFAVAAHAKPAADRADRAFVLRLSPKGEIRWSKYAGRGESQAADLRETPDGGFVVAGIARAKSDTRPALWAARLDRSGQTQWESHYEGPGTPSAARIEIARGHELVIAATMTGLTPAAGDAVPAALRLLRLAENGKTLWDRRYADAARHVAGLMLTRGGIVVAGDAGADAARPELWVAHFDAGGRLQRESRLPAAKGDAAAALVETHDRRLALAGTAEIEGAARRGAGLTFLDRGGNLLAER